MRACVVNVYIGEIIAVDTHTMPYGISLPENLLMMSVLYVHIETKRPKVCRFQSTASVARRVYRTGHHLRPPEAKAPISTKGFDCTSSPSSLFPLSPLLPGQILALQCQNPGLSDLSQSRQTRKESATLLPPAP